jgi:hypothetical protein
MTVRVSSRASCCARAVNIGHHRQPGGRGLSVNQMRVLEVVMRSKMMVLVFASLAFPNGFAGQSRDEGYRWAREKDVTDPDACRARARQDVDDSAAFIEGCTDYLRDEDLLNDDDDTIDDSEGFESD